MKSMKDKKNRLELEEWIRIKMDSKIDLFIWQKKK